MSVVNRLEPAERFLTIHHNRILPHRMLVLNMDFLQLLRDIIQENKWFIYLSVTQNHLLSNMVYSFLDCKSVLFQNYVLFYQKMFLKRASSIVGKSLVLNKLESTPSAVFRLPTQQASVSSHGPTVHRAGHNSFICAAFSL